MGLTSPYCEANNALGLCIHLAHSGHYLVLSTRHQMSFQCCAAYAQHARIWVDGQYGLFRKVSCAQG